MSEIKRAYIELLQKALNAFKRIDIEEYEAVLGDDESANVVAGTLKRMIKNVEESDDEAWGRSRPDLGE